MKYRIKFSAGKWHAIEPGGEVCWHFMTLGEACDWVRKMTG